MTHGSLFSGIGGFDLAAEWAGFENLFHCEWNPFCRQVLKYHFPNSESYEDITKTDFTKWRGKIDVLTGGFPCQPFSVAGRRKGAEDDRYLWPQMLRAIKEIQPTWVIGENVAGILTMVLPGEEIEVGGYTDVTGEGYKEIENRQMYIVERICQDFERIGYSVQPVIIPACAVGAPHRRDRIWFIAHRSDTGTETQRQGTDEVFSTEFIANTNVKRWDDGNNNREERHLCDHQERHSEKDKSKWNEWKFGVSSPCSTASDTKRFGGDKIHEDLQFKQPERERIDSSCDESDVANSNKLNGELSGLCSSEISKQQTTGIFKNISGWDSFPTQSPVCNRDDGLSIGLSGISFSKWRQESIKALGNAIVPQVAYEIFKAIKIIETI